MNKEHSWLDDLRDVMPDLSQNNPHNRIASLHYYLTYYGFDRNNLSSYRAGLVTSRRYKVFTQHFQPANPEAAVLLIHGFLDHSGGLSKTVNAFLEQNCEVILFDLPGHGLSDGLNGEVISFDDYLDALRDVYETVKINVFCDQFIGAGHSTGAAILYHASSIRMLPFSSLILVSPLYFPHRWTWTRGFIHYTTKLLRRTKRVFKRNSEDRSYRAFIKEDPLQVQWIGTHWLKAMEAWQMRMHYSPVLRIPVYLIQGGRDNTVDEKENIRFYRQKCPNMQICYIPGGRHQLLNEQRVIRADVHERMIEFLRQPSVR
ncbi:alpha/beta hydrolase [Salisediminibacterium halotolerans]|uniref:alpha/beta hydrolase n=1 Tax=Salisediminibacterium halotolerans TaxID=517425 RepID=UPI000EB10372|nr:alpha/beta hydrolase [Salisediminibacterium halotolerans]RLJ74087.1 alpha-beta hydrolase superfamily lysophospholipase [Actinophytocola xinjiangensis]RPE87820.1 alpha-beta hydrolase superfamily lysophospholipase [Salisediminibacterium halotolerans]TWG34924.1 alpha-beta hydrolase superfamily lysophospholipase [Salisediminibacterium halotolerans]GEL07889.1 lysophospholipase [Salisediminibacterium halotolerans]